MIDVLVDAGFPVKVCCRKLGVSSPGYYRCRQRPLAPTKMRRQWLTGLIREVHLQSRGTYGYRRVHAELTRGMGLVVSDRLVWFLMHDAGIRGLPHLTGKKPIRGIPTADDLVNRRFHRDRPNELWVTDITEHPTREGKVFCCCVLDAFSRRIIGWSIDSVQNSNLVVNALDMAIKNRRPEPGGVVHADHGTQTGLNWSSQHLDSGGEMWVTEIGRSRYVSIGDRYLHQVHRQLRGAVTASCSGHRLLGAQRPKRPLLRRACLRRLPFDGSATLEG